MDPATAVLAALEEEGASGLGYVWPERSCCSLVRALCRHLGTPEPAYGPWEALDERKAGVECVRSYGSMGVAHQTGLIQTGAWEHVAVKDDEERTVAPRPGDVISFEGKVWADNGEVYTPPATGFEVTGVCGVYGFRWYWSAKGLATVALGTITRITRAR